MSQMPGAGELQTLHLLGANYCQEPNGNNIFDVTYGAISSCFGFFGCCFFFNYIGFYFYYRNVVNLLLRLDLSKLAGATPSKLLETWLIPSSQITSICQFM